MKKTFLISVLTLITFCGFPQSKIGNIILNKFVSNLLENSPVLIKGECKVTNEELDISENFLTTIIIDKTEYYAEVEEISVISTETEFININNDIKEITILDKADAEEEIGINPFVLLINHKEYFDSNLKSKNGDIIILELNSKKPNLFTQVTITLDKSKNKVTKMIFVDDNNTEYDYTISEFNKKVSNNKIKFDKKDYPNYSIIDMR